LVHPIEIISRHAGDDRQTTERSPHPLVTISAAPQTAQADAFVTARRRIHLTFQLSSSVRALAYIGAQPDMTDAPRVIQRIVEY
jgi:hypothetical protein